MTPDDVVARARELVGQRVHLTVDGVVSAEGDWVFVNFDHGLAVTLLHSRYGVSKALVDIQPAPLRIVTGQLYVDDNGALWKGGPERIDRPNGLLWSFGHNSTWDYEPSRMPGLRAVNLVDA